MSAQDTIKRIQEEARKRVADAANAARQKAMQPTIPVVSVMKSQVVPEPVVSEAKSVAPVAPTIPVESQVIPEPVISETKPVETVPVFSEMKPKSVTSEKLISKQVQELINKIQDKIEDDAFASTIVEPESFVLPKNCRFYQFNGKVGQFIIEESPTMRVIPYFNHNSRNTEHVQIPLPYVIHLFSFIKEKNQFSVYNYAIGFSQKPILSIDDQLLISHLPHVYDHNVCLPDRTFEKANDLNSLSNNQINLFWNSLFHYGITQFSCADKVISDFENWSLLSTLEIMKAKFNKGRTIRYILDSFAPVESETLTKSVQVLLKVVEGNKNFIENLIENTVDQIINSRK